VDHVTSADHVGAGRPAGQRAVERPTRPSTSDTPTASTHPAAEFPVASPPIVLAVHGMIVTSWDRTAVRWASLQEAAARRGLALSTRHQVGTALAAVFGGGVDVGKAPDGTWGYPVTELWVATCTWLAGHGIDPLAIYATFASTAPCAVALPAALAVRDQCDLTNSRRLMEDLRRLGIGLDGLSPRPSRWVPSRHRYATGLIGSESTIGMASGIVRQTAREQQWHDQVFDLLSEFRRQPTKSGSPATDVRIGRATPTPTRQRISR
jgi:hypothetical protein